MCILLLRTTRPTK